MVVSPIATTHGSMNQRVEVRVEPLTTSPIDPLAEFLLPVPMTLRSDSLEVLVPKEECFQQEPQQ